MEIYEVTSPFMLRLGLFSTRELARKAIIEKGDIGMTYLIQDVELHIDKEDLTRWGQHEQNNENERT